MSLFQTLTQSPNRFSNYYSPKNGSFNAATYEEYFQHKLKQKQSQRKKNGSVSAKSKNIKSKSKAKKQKNQKRKKRSPKIPIQSYKIDPMYASRVSQMLSQIQVPQNEQRITKQELRKLQSKIISEVLSLREQKILALQNLNKMTDKKNKAVELIKGFEVLKQTSRLNEDNSDNEEDEEDIVSKFSRFQKSPNQINKQYNSRLSKKSTRPNDIISSKLQQQMRHIQNSHAQASKIRQQLMRPLIQHPLLERNKQLRLQLQQLQLQLSQSRLNKHSIVKEIDFYKNENEKLSAELERQQTKLSSIQHKRFETFFPKDKILIDQVNKLIAFEESLSIRKEELEHELMNGTIIRKAEDQIIIEQLREQNRRLVNNCEQLISNQGRSRIKSQYENMSVQQLQNLVQRQVHNKQVFSQLLNQFRQKVSNLQQQKINQRKRNQRVSHYY